MLKNAISLTLIFVLICHSVAMAKGPIHTPGVCNGLRPRAMGEREEIYRTDDGITIPDRSASGAMLKLTQRHIDAPAGEKFYRNYLKFSYEWAPHYDKNKGNIRSVAAGVGRNKVVVLGPSPGMFDQPLNLLAEFSEIVIVDYDFSSLRHDMETLGNDNRFKDKKIIYCRADITGKVKGFVEGIENAYRQARGDYEVAETSIYVGDNSVYRRILEVEPRLSLAEGADLVISSNILTELYTPLFEYQSGLCELHFPPRILGKIGLDTSLKIEEMQRIGREMLRDRIIAQHFGFLSRLIKENGRIYLSAQQVELYGGVLWELAHRICRDNSYPLIVWKVFDPWQWDFRIIPGTVLTIQAVVLGRPREIGVAKGQLDSLPKIPMTDIETQI